MIPVLYGTTEGLFSIGDKFADNDNDILYSYEGDPRFDYDTLGIGALTDTISCLVHEVRNGQYELTMTYPITGIRYENIREGAIIKAIPAKNKDAELFRIYSITKPINGIIEIHAEHISYQLSSIPVMPFEADSLATALLGLKSNSAESNPFTFWTDKAVASPYRQKVPASCRARLGGEQGSILDTYGGEFEFVGYTVKLWNNRGTDRGVQLRYGKNIVDLTQETNIADTVTGICPYWASEDGVVVTLPENVISSMKANSFPYHRTIVVDFSGDFEEQPTVDQLRARAEQYIDSEGIGIPKVSIEVSFVDLSASDDFSDKALLEQVNLCDTVTVIFDPYGIEAKSKVVETNWDVLRDRYESITLGTVTTNLASIVSQDAQNTKNEIAGAKTNLQAAIDHATNQITGVTGGYVVINRDANGDPYELLVMNTPNIDTATRVWRWNQNGLGVSNNGYGGPYETAMTADGHFVADFITAGTLLASLIKTGILTDNAGNFYLDMDTGTLVMQNGSFSGTVTSNNATITGGTINIQTNNEVEDIIELNGPTTFVRVRPNSFAVRNKTNDLLNPDRYVLINGARISVNKVESDNSLTTLVALEAPQTGAGGLYLRDENGNSRTLTCHIGDYVYNSNSSSLTIPTNTYTDVASISLDAGLWMIVGSFHAQAISVPFLMDVGISPSGYLGIECGQTTIPDDDHQTYWFNPSYQMSLPNTTTICLRVFQSSGSNMNVSANAASIRAIRIR